MRLARKHVDVRVDRNAARTLPQSTKISTQETEECIHLDNNFMPRVHHAVNAGVREDDLGRDCANTSRYSCRITSSAYCTDSSYRLDIRLLAPWSWDISDDSGAASCFEACQAIVWAKEVKSTFPANTRRVPKVTRRDMTYQFVAVRYCNTQC